MKELSLKQMSLTSGGDECDKLGGFAIGLTTGLVILGVASGGLGFFVGAGLATYFGATGALLCQMGSNLNS